MEVDFCTDNFSSGSRAPPVRVYYGSGIALKLNYHSFFLRYILIIYVFKVYNGVIS